MEPITAPRANRRRRRGRAAALAGLAALATGGTLATAPGAAIPIVKALHNAQLNRTLVVTATGRTLYRHTGETSHHLLCVGMCTRVWPPLTVASASTVLVRGPGVTGTLTKFRRPDGRWQVTLRGYPLYRFASDHRGGDVHGQNVEHVWFVVPARASAPPASGAPSY
jgi:predicted lipoprotein with Yx(FWY)xxD motif